MLPSRWLADPVGALRVGRRVRLAARVIPLVMAVIAGGAARPDGAPSLTGYVRTADFASAEGAEVRVRGSLEIVRVGEDGRFVLPLRAGLERAEVSIALDGYFRAVHPAPRSGSGDIGTVLLVPRRWRIATGRHAGTEVAVDLAGASGGACRGCGTFYADVLGEEDSELPPGIPTWPPTAFPLEVAFDRDNGSRISEADSVAFWRIVRSLEDAFGLRLFRPAPLPAVLANVSNDGPGSLLVMVDPRLPSIGWGSSVAQSGTILAGSVRFRATHTFSGAGAAEVVGHEIFHALGFGHTCAWRSIVADPRRCRSLQSARPTPEDVAHTQLLWRIRDLEREARVWRTVEAALEGEGLLR